MDTPRRSFLLASSAAVFLAASRSAGAGSPASPASPALPAASTPKPADRERPIHDPALAREFVAAAHGNLEKVKALLAREPRLVFASVDTGNIGPGDWETGLNGAAHTGNRTIALHLLEHGARIDAFCAAALGYTEVVLALLKADPRTATVKGPHNLNLLYHAAIGGEVAMAEAIKPHLPADSVEFNQALGAAARDGRLEMTRWLLANGVTDVNAPDGFRRTPLKIATSKGFNDVAAVLRAAGGRE